MVIVIWMQQRKGRCAILNCSSEETSDLKLFSGWILRFNWTWIKYKKLKTEKNFWFHWPLTSGNIHQTIQKRIVSVNRWWPLQERKREFKYLKGTLKRRQDVLGGVQCEARGAKHRSQEEVPVSAVRACDASDGPTCAIPRRSATNPGVYPLACYCL